MVCTGHFLLCCVSDATHAGDAFEDPYLTGELGAAIIRGYQGDSLDSDESILACAKHYIGYGEAVGARDACDTQMTYRKMRETFLPPFKKAIDAGCATVMTAYGFIDGTPLTVDKHTIKDILRDELGFDGFAVTDWNNVHSFVHLQYVSKDAEEASAAAADAGNDMIMRSEEFYEGALAAVRNGKLSEAVIDEAVRNILTMKLRMGLFEKPEKKGVPGCIGCDEHQQASLRVARKSMLLHRNRAISTRELAEKLWPDEMDTMLENIRGHVYRFRRDFKLIADLDLIWTEDGKYLFNPNLILMTDLELFDQLYTKAVAETDERQKIHMLKKAARLYKGYLYPEASSEHWLMALAADYHLRYLELMDRLLQQLSDEGGYRTMWQEATRALSIEKGNVNLHYWAIFSLIKQGTIDLAKNATEMAKKSLTSEDYSDLIQKLKSL